MHEPFMFVLKTKILQDFDRRCLGSARYLDLYFLNKGPGARAGHFPSFFSLFYNAKNPFFRKISMALCMRDHRVGDTSGQLAKPQEMGLARRGFTSGASSPS